MTVDAMKKLTKRQQDFVQHYLACLNGPEAARRAGYAPGSVMHIAAINLRHPAIRAWIDEGLAALAMGRNEILARRAEQARGDIRAFLTFDAAGNPVRFKLTPDTPTHLIKKIKITETTRPGDDQLLDTQIEVELYAADSALDSLAKIAGLLREQSGGTLLTVTPAELAAMGDDEINELARKRGLL